MARIGFETIRFVRIGFDWKRDGWKGLDLFGKVWIGWIGLGRI